MIPISIYLPCTAQNRKKKKLFHQRFPLLSLCFQCIITTQKSYLPIYRHVEAYAQGAKHPKPTSTKTLESESFRLRWIWAHEQKSLNWHSEKNKSHKWNRKLHFSVSSLILCHFVSVFELVSFRFVLLCLWLWFFICLFLCLCLSSYRNHVESFNRWFHWYCGCGCGWVFSFHLIFRLPYMFDPNAHTQNNTFDQFSGFLYRFDLPIYKQQLNTRNDVLAKYNQWPFSAKIYDDKMTCGTTHILKSMCV